MNSGNQVKYHTIWLCRIIQTHTRRGKTQKSHRLVTNFKKKKKKSECEMRGKSILSREKKKTDRHFAEQISQPKPHCSSYSSSL